MACPRTAFRLWYKGAAMPLGGARLNETVSNSRLAHSSLKCAFTLHRTRKFACRGWSASPASGRILNPRTAHSQYMGGMIWGIGSAIHEQTGIDPRTSRYVQRKLG